MSRLKKVDCSKLQLEIEKLQVNCLTLWSDPAVQNYNLAVAKRLIIVKI